MKLITTNNLPENKEQIKDFVSSIMEAIKQGEMSPLEVKARAVILKKAMESIESDKWFNEQALNEAEGYALKSFEANGVTYTISEVGVKYNYSNCGSSEYDKVCKDIADLTSRKKELEKMLQAIPEGKTIADPETGEVLRRPTKTSTTRVNTKI